MRDPSYACTMNARPAMSADVPPVDTLKDPLALPAEVDVAQVVHLQPTLLASSRKRLAAKIALLRELCTDDEWAALLQRTSFARALTASIDVIGRLRDAPRPEDGSPRPVTSILLMSKRQFAEATGADPVTLAPPRSRRRRATSKRTRAPRAPRPPAEDASEAP